MSRHVLVCGSAHLDVLGRALHHDDLIDRIGDVSIEVGGTACNIAINLAHAGASVRLLTAMNRSSYSKIIEEYLTSSGIDTLIERSKDLPTGVFTAHIDTKGEMVSAVSSMPVEMVEFEEKRIVAAMDGVQVVVMDCNLSISTIDRITRIANEMNIPAYASAVSQEKSLRLIGVSGIKGIFINRKEFEYMCNASIGRVVAPSYLSQMYQTNLLVTNGAEGSTIAYASGLSKHILPADVGRGGSRLGMGDAFVAGVIFHHEFGGLSLANAADAALNTVTEIGRTVHCNLGKNDVLETAIAGIQHQAGHDAMTGVLNRRSTESALMKALERRARGTGTLSMLLLDIDHFKSINDTYGHNVGDEVIINVTRVAQACLRDSDYMGRWGGEEFIVALPDTTREDALMVADRIRKSIEREVLQPRPITVSIGFSEAIDSIGDMTELVGAADKALYEAKRGGRNRVVG